LRKKYDCYRLLSCAVLKICEYYFAFKRSVQRMLMIWQNLLLRTRSTFRDLQETFKTKKMTFILALRIK